MEICPTMRALAKCERLTPPACASSFSAEARLTRVPCHAGARPNKIPVSSETRAVNANTRASRPTSGRTGNVGGVRRSSTGRTQFVSTSPTPPLNNASNTLSVSTCRINRQRVAPIEERTAISRRRARARASMRLAALAQAMTSTIRTAPISTAVNAHTVPRKGDGTVVDGKTAAPKSLLYLGSISSSRRINAVNSASACGALTPGVKRPTPKCENAPVRVCHSGSCRTTGAIM